MKNVVNHLLSIMLIGVIVLNMVSPLAVFAIEKDAHPVDNGETQQDNLNEKVEETPKTNMIAKGNIEIELHLVLPIKNVSKNNMKMIISDEFNHQETVDLNQVNEPQDGYCEKTVKLGDQNVRTVITERDMNGHLLSGVDEKENVVYLSVNLYALNKGKYKISFSGKNFVSYSREVVLDQFSKRIYITDEKGMFEIGDVNNDGHVNDEDYSKMIQAIESNLLEYDLNLDGVVDIADLNYVTAILESEKKEAQEENTNAIIDSENVVFDYSKESLLEDSADLSSLFQDEGTIKVQQVDNKPIELGIDFQGGKEPKTVEMSEIRVTVGENAPQDMYLEVEHDDGTVEKVYPISNNQNGVHPFTEDATDNTLKFNLKGQTAVKKVTIVVTKTSGNNLAEIAKVEFLNNVKVETKEPENFYTPKTITVDDSVSEQLTVHFSSVPNVTGYEVKIVGPQMDKIFQTTYNTFTIEDLKNYKTYDIYVQSVNQEWRSGFNKEPVKAMPKSTRRPPAVDMVTATPTYSGIDFGWKDMDDTLSYNLYYRKVGSDTWNKVDQEINQPSYSLKGLEAAVEYEAYVTGNNPLGEGEASQIVKTKTLEAAAAITPKYKLINQYNDAIKRTDHIKEINTTLGTMVNGDQFAMADDNYLSYWSYENWQVSASAGFAINAPIFVLDKSYQMDEFVLTVPDSYSYQYKSGTYDVNSQSKNDTLVHYWNEEANPTEANKTTVSGVLTRKTDENGRVYYVLKLQEPIIADKIQFGITVANNNRSIQIDEVKFYQYDSLVKDVAKLFVDDLRVELQKDVTQQTIDKLRKRANTKDNGEYSPYRDSVLADLEYAEKILKDEKLNDVITLNPNISNTYNSHLGFAMTINDYQPLGVVARPGDTLNVYVGSTGQVNIQLIYTQYYAEANAWSKSYNLQKGQNIIKIDQIGSASSERGGSVYVRYTSKPDLKNPIKVRVSGGQKIPVLDVSTCNSDDEKTLAIKTYINALDKYNNSLQDQYKKEGKTFDNRTSVLASTEIVTKHGLFSFSSLAVLNAINSSLTTEKEKIERVFESTAAFDEMMEMFYRQKGLKENAEDPKDEMPKSRINIRYMRMFDGAFMYAGGYHIGIEYGSIAGLIQGKRNNSKQTGYFGWGISHEIGHQINQSKTVFAEVTNNIYALLAQTSNDTDKSRLELSNIYEKIYEKVTSHMLGRAQNVFVQLGMYWQLHLAYDNNKTFDDENSIYSKINHISRTYENVNKYGRDELTILYACMASQKDLTEFFEIWGLKASDTLKEEIASLHLEKETSKIYYLNDAARRYRLSGKSKIQETTQLSAKIKEASSEDKRVTLTFNVNQENDKILGYEILRNGTSIGFVDKNTTTFVDNIGAENNRAYTYQVVAYDYLLNPTNTVTLDEVKISHDGSIVKDKFTIESNVKEKGEVVDNEDEKFDYSKLHVNQLIDGDQKTAFKGTEKISTLNQTTDKPSLTKDNGNAYVIINLNQAMSISGIKYRALVKDNALDENTVKKYNIYISSNKEDWTLARTGEFKLTGENPEETVYFMGQGTTSQSQLWTYHDVGYVKIESVGNKNGFSGTEIDVIAPPGDNVDITEENGLPSIGILEKDYCYLTEGCNKEEVDEDGNPVGIIEKDSVVIQGNYRGNPSFNQVLLADANNEKQVYDGYFLIFAELNADKSVYEVSSGTWIYVMTKDQYQKMIQESSYIRAYLYRVNDALTFEGQRLTSTSKAVTNLKAYEQLPKIEITNTIDNN